MLGYWLFGSPKIPFQKIFGYGKRVISISLEKSIVPSAAPEKSPFFTSEKRPPLGLGFLISLMRNEGHTVFFIDNYLKPSNFIEEGYLQKNNIDFVGIYANTSCYRDTLKMFNEIENQRKKSLWNGKIIFGGI